MSDRAVLYARVSGDDRGKEGRNLASQLEMAREYAIERGYAIVAELAEDDRGASSVDLDLEKLNEALSMARDGEFDVLIVRELDRFARSLAKQLIIETEFKQAGIRIEYVIEEYEDTPEGILRKNLRATIAEYERLKIAERTKRAKRNKARDGHVVACSRIPYGYELVQENGRKTLKPHEPEAGVVRMIYDAYTGNGVEREAARAIVRRLGELGIQTWSDLHPGPSSSRRKPRSWSPSSVYKILQNPLYKGEWHFADVEMSVPPLISPDVWDAAQYYRKANRIASVRNRKHNYLLAGRIRCGACGAAMRGLTATHGTMRDAPIRYRYYRCLARYEKNYSQECDMPSFRLEEVDAAVWARVTHWLDDPLQLEAGFAGYQERKEQELAPIRERVKTIDELLAENTGKLQRLVDLYLSAEIEKELLVDRKRHLEETIRSLRAERARQTAILGTRDLTDMQVRDISGFAQKVRAGLAKAESSFEARREVLELLNVEVVCFVEEGVKKVRVTAAMGLDDVLSVVSTSSSCYNLSGN